MMNNEHKNNTMSHYYSTHESKFTTPKRERNWRADAEKRTEKLSTEK